MGKAQKRWPWSGGMRTGILKKDGEKRGSKGAQRDRAWVLVHGWEERPG